MLARWGTWSIGSMRADRAAQVEHYGAAASMEHTEQLYAGAHGAVAL